MYIDGSFMIRKNDVIRDPAFFLSRISLKISQHRQMLARGGLPSGLYGRCPSDAFNGRSSVSSCQT